MYQITYTAKNGSKLSRDALTLDDAKRDARRIAKRNGCKVQIWIQSGRLVATI